MRAIFFSALVPAIAAAVGVVAFGMLGDRGIIALIAGMTVFLVGIVVWKRPDLALTAAFPVLVCTPFFLSFGSAPRIYADQTLLIALYGVVTLKILLRAEPTNLGWMDIFAPAFSLAMLGMTLLVNQSSLEAIRGFLEIMCFSMPLCVLCAHIATARTAERTAMVLAFAVIVVAMIGAAEVLYGSNPIMEYASERHEGEFAYISGEMVAASDAFYRPYAVFSNPSEGGTVVALCLPFIAVLLGGEKKFWRVAAGAALAAGFVFVVLTATRGVWFSLFLTTILFLPRFRKACVLAAPVFAGGLFMSSFFFSRMRLWDRIADFRNLRIRFWYWEQALSLAENNALFGLGFGNFATSYLSLDPAISTEFAADINQVMTVDNMFLMILVEQGVFGLAGFLLLCGFLFLRLFKTRSFSIAQGRPRSADFALAAMACLCIYLFCGVLADVHLFNKATKLVFMLSGMGWGLSLNTQEKYGSP
ncbi:MAG: O-antigen ligase family protein [Planctomycetota bacterium]|jgi:hypothetical protein|nr:O-antigen ligase family protein [Planctomycetota bacterium]